MPSSTNPDRPAAREKIRALARAPTGIAAAVVIVAAAGALALFWLWPRPDAVRSSSPRPHDLSQLFRNDAGDTLDDGDVCALRDPGCARSFALRLTQPVFVRMSRNCRYVISVESGRARANFLDPSKGAVDLAPGRGWTATDFWSLTPLTREAAVRLDPNT